MTMKDQIAELKLKLPSLAIIRAVPSMRGPGIMDVSLMAAEPVSSADKPVAGVADVRQALVDAGLVADTLALFPGAGGPLTHTYYVRGLRPDPKLEKAKTKPAAAAAAAASKPKG